MIWNVPPVSTTLLEHTVVTLLSMPDPAHVS
jgi:hypothetical protein